MDVRAPLLFVYAVNYAKICGERQSVEELIVCRKKIAIDCYICSVVLLMDFLHQARMVYGGWRRGGGQRGAQP